MAPDVFLTSITFNSKTLKIDLSSYIAIRVSRLAIGSDMQSQNTRRAVQGNMWNMYLIKLMQMKLTSTARRITILFFFIQNRSQLFKIAHPLYRTHFRYLTNRLVAHPYKHEHIRVKNSSLFAGYCTPVISKLWCRFRPWSNRLVFEIRWWTMGFPAGLSPCT